jgi:membrane protein
MTGLSSVAVVLLRIGRFALIWLLFTAGYVMLPNTRVRFGAALFGALVGAVIYLLVEWLYFKSQVGLAGYSSAYGGFAALPLFLTWVQVTWMIVLFGAEMAFSIDNAETYGYAPDYSRLSSHTRRLLQLQIAHFLGRAFERSEGPLTLRQISGRIEVPTRLLRRLLEELTAAGLVSCTLHIHEHHTAYQPARNLEQLTPASILDTVERHSPSPDGEPPFAGVLPAALVRFQAAIERAPKNARLTDIELNERPGSQPSEIAAQPEAKPKSQENGGTS